MIDWHSHILPGMDDGSRDVEESLALLELQRQQGVDTVVATPHFRPNDEPVSLFLERRADTFEELKAALPADAPEIRLGAEVQYYAGISRMEDLKALRIEQTDLLLLEMPMTVWSESMVKELLELSGKTGITLLLAHIDRYLGFQRHVNWDELIQNGILMQVNASFFTTKFTRRKAIAWLNKGRVHVIGSDCHNVTSRPPTIGKAYEAIRQKCGDDYLLQMDEFGHFLLVDE